MRDQPGARPHTTEWLSTAAAAERIGVSVRTLYRLIDHGEVPAYRMGRVIRLTGREVAAHIESSQTKPGTISHLYPETSQ